MERYFPLFVVKVENGMEWNGMERRFADLCLPPPVILRHIWLILPSPPNITSYFMAATGVLYSTFASGKKVTCGAP